MTTLASDVVTIEAYGKADSRKELPTALFVEKFSELIADYSKEDWHFLFYVKPSGVPAFGVCLQLAQTNGFEVGYDAAREHELAAAVQPRAGQTQS